MKVPNSETKVSRIHTVFLFRIPTDKHLQVFGTVSTELVLSLLNASNELVL